MNEEAMTRVGLQSHNNKKIEVSDNARLLKKIFKAKVFISPNFEFLKTVFRK